MSTPIPPNIKSEGLDLYAPRGARTPSTQHQLRADEHEQPSEAAAVLLSAGDIPVNEGIGTARSLADQEPSISAPSLPPAPTLTPVNEPPTAFAPWLRTAPRRPRLDPA